jgi:hypothetical protein
MKNSFQHPDFAFPKTVKENASTTLASAEKSGNYENVVMALIQMTIAQAQISRDDTQSLIPEYERLAQRIPAPYSQILYSIEAELYSEFYDKYCGSYSYRDRNNDISNDSIPTDLSLWDKKLFAAKVNELIHKSLSDSNALSHTAISKIKNLLEELTDKQESYYPTVYDLLTYRAVEMLSKFAPTEESSSAIPFDDAVETPTTIYDTIKDYRRVVIDSLIEVCEHNAAAYVQALALKYKLFKQESDCLNYIKECYAKVCDTPHSLKLLADMAQYTDDSLDAEYYALCKSKLQQFPTADYAPNVAYIIDRMENKEVSVSVEGKVAIDSPIAATVTSRNYSRLYLLLIKRSDSQHYDKTWRVKELKSHGTVMEAVELKHDDNNVNIRYTDTITFAPQKCGEYVVVPSTTPDKSGILLSSDHNNSVETFDVGVIAAFFATDKRNREECLYVVDGRNMQPISGAQVSTSKQYNGSSKVVGTTNDEGAIILPDDDRFIYVTKDNEVLSDRYYLSSLSTKSGARCAIFTGLQLYHPGDTVRISVVKYAYATGTFTLCKQQPVKLKLTNPERDKISEMTITTDDYGRATAEFVIPKEAVLGEYGIQADNGYPITNVTVAEYKAPSFFVECNLQDMHGFRVGDDIIISGVVKSYSGVAMANAAVVVTVNFHEFSYWRFSGDKTSYSKDVVTDAEGAFELRLSTKRFPGTKFEKGIYSTNATVTSEGGETQTSPTEYFILGNRYAINPELPDMVNLSELNDGILSAKVRLSDAMDHDTSGDIRFTLTNATTGEEITDGTFAAPDFKLITKGLASGEYSLKYYYTNSSNGDEITAESAIILYRNDDKVPPVATALWVPNRGITLSAKQKSVEITVGTSYKNSWIFCAVSTNDSVVSRRWIKIDGKNDRISVEVPSSDEPFWVNLQAIHDFKYESATVEVVPQPLLEEMKIEVESFRDKIRPGDNESWRFRFSVGDKPCGIIPAMAVMSNKSLNAIVPFRWSFSPDRSSLFANPYDVDAVDLSGSDIRDYGSSTPLQTPFYMTTPGLNYYDYSLLNAYSHRLMSRSNALYLSGEVRSCYAAPMAAMDGAAEDMVMAYAKEEDVAMEQTEDTSDANTTLRSDEMPLAFFYPNLTTDANGALSLNFEVPDFNTTWQLQLLGYDSQLHADVKVLDVVSAKPIIVKTNPTRFMRTNDTATLSATISNNSDEPQTINATIEVVEPMSGKVISTKVYRDMAFDPKASGVITIDFATPDSQQMLALRVRATAGNFSDGEQAYLSVLPSSSPVFESTPFYLNADSNELELQLPKYSDDSTVTLQYCDNPIWYCVTALPSVADNDSENLLSLLYTLYGYSLAAGLQQRYPQISDAMAILATMDNGSAKSPLQQNEALKTLALSSTIWTHDANAESMRIAKLQQLLDTEQSAAKISDLIDRICKLQNQDGGFSWMPQMSSSVYMTSAVLLRLGMLKQMQSLQQDADLDQVIRKAIAYCDRETLKQYERDKHEIYLHSAVSYLYIRSFYDAESTAEFVAYKDKALKVINKQWRSLGIYDAATAAILLNRYGYTPTAKTILTSLEQRSTTTPSQGTYFDNLTSEWHGWNKLITTAQVLEAFDQITPTSPYVDAIRQWLLVQRQAQNWGSNSDTAEIIYAILSSGTDWTIASQPAQFMVGDKIIAPSSRDLLTGEFTLPLDAKEASGATLRIVKHGNHPAWGGVVKQLILPMTEVVENAIPDLSITKRITRVNSTTTGEQLETPDSFQVGDRVRVTLIITSKRDMDYVAITDQMPACMARQLQTAKYLYQEGLWHYLEPRTAQTNIFIDYLSKGTHILTYDCFVNANGAFANGIATIQSQYAPLLVAHSSGDIILVK